jgi:hypothetical protein
METETGNSLPLLDAVVYRNGRALLTKIYRKFVHTLTVVFISIPTILLKL